MQRSAFQQQNYKRNKAILQKISTKEIKALPDKLRKLYGKKSFEKAKNKFIEQVCKKFPEYKYLLSSKEAAGFIAQFFMTGNVSEQTLEGANLSGVVWVIGAKNDPCLYLKILPGTNPKWIYNFLLNAQNSPHTVFPKLKNISHLQPDTRLKKENKNEIKTIAANLNYFDIQALVNLLKATYPQVFKVLFPFGIDNKAYMVREKIISAYLFHAYDYGSIKKGKKAMYSPKTIERMLLENPYKPKLKKKTPTFRERRK